MTNRMDESPWASGYHLDLMTGPNAVPVMGLFVRPMWLLRTPIANTGIDWKVGVWDTIVGYESSSDPLNPNFTRSYGYQMEPTTETGILGTYKINDMVSVSAGIANGDSGGAGGAFNVANAAPGTPPETQKTYMGSVTFTAPDSFGVMKGATVTFAAIDSLNSQGGNNANGFLGKNWYYLGATIPTPLNALKVGASLDYVEQHNSFSAPVAANGSDDSSSGYGSLRQLSIQRKVEL